MTPTSVPGVFNQRGFTLVEILVVMLLMGIVAAAVVVNISPSDSQAVQIEASRLADMLEQTAEDAQDSGETIAWQGQGDSYAFWKKNDQGDWQEIADDNFYRSGNLGNDVGFGAIRVEGVILPPDQRLVFNPSGVNRPFVITLQKGAASASISSDAMNRMKVK